MSCFSYTIAMLIVWMSSSRFAFGFTDLNLDNGFKALIVSKKNAATSEIRFWVRAGSAHENPNFTNTAHIIEHLMFSTYSKSELPFFTQAKSKAQVNASTRHFATVYSTQTTAEHLKEMIELEAKRMISGPMLESGDLTREAEIIKKEHLRTYSQLPYQLWREFYKIGFPGHPLQWHTSGNADHFSKLSNAEIHSFFNSNYRPDNSCIAIVSSVDESQVATWVKSSFSRWKAGPPAKKEVVPPTWPGIGPFIKFSAKSDRPQAALIGFRVPLISGLTPIEMDFLNHIFVRSQKSALRNQLRFGSLMTWDYGDLNYDYDWFTIKAVVLADKFQSSEGWKQLLVDIAKYINGLSNAELDAMYQEFYLETQEAHLKSASYADWLGLQCGKYGRSELILVENFTEKKTFLRKVQSVLKPTNMVVVVHGN